LITISLCPLSFVQPLAAFPTAKALYTIPKGTPVNPAEEALVIKLTRAGLGESHMPQGMLSTLSLVVVLPTIPCLAQFPLPLHEPALPLHPQMMDRCVYAVFINPMNPCLVDSMYLGSLLSCTFLHPTHSGVSALPVGGPRVCKVFAQTFQAEVLPLIKNLRDGKSGTPPPPTCAPLLYCHTRTPTDDSGAAAGGPEGARREYADWSGGDGSGG
jgi:hypothetical protein